MGWADFFRVHDDFRVLRGLLTGTAFVAGVAGFFGAPLWIAVILALLGLHAHTVVLATRRLADMQAALDMKQMVLHPEPGQLTTPTPGDILEFKRPVGGSVKLRFHTSAKVEILP